MEKTKYGIKKDLRQQWEQACNGYLNELLRMWDLHAHYGYWVAEEVGGLYDYAGEWTISMNDIIYCVEHDVEYHDYQEWSDYCVDAHEFNLPIPNIKSWMMGCPRTSEENFDNLRKAKADLEAAVEEEQERLRNEETNNPF